MSVFNREFLLYANKFSYVWTIFEFVIGVVGIFNRSSAMVPIEPVNVVFHRQEVGQDISIFGHKFSPKN